MAVDKEEALPTGTKGVVQRSRPAESIEVTIKSLYFDYYSTFWGNVLEVHMQGGVLVVANVVGFRGAF